MTSWLEAAADLDWGQVTGHRWATPGDLAAAVFPGTIQTPALDVIDTALIDVEEGRCNRLIVCMPPQEGKSTRVTQTGPLWFLSRNPDRRIAIACFSQELATDFGRTIRNLIDTHAGEDGELDLGLRIARDNGAAQRWALDGARGGVRAIGLRGGLTGRPVDALFIDDPISNRAQAMSSAYRDMVWGWWESVGLTRLAPGAPVVLVLTRWHEDDLAGRLIAQAVEQGEPDRWRVVSIPAIADSPEDPLGRAIGEPMVSARDHVGRDGSWVRRDFEKTRRAVGEWTWSALYQQRPTPSEGGLFKRSDLRRWSNAPDTEYGRIVQVGDDRFPLADCWRFVTVDLAASTKTSADFTAIGAWAVTPDGNLLLLDLILDRLDPTQHFVKANQLREAWDARTIYAETAWMGTTMAYEAGRAGIPLEELKPDSDKWTRALPASALSQQGRLWMPPSTAGQVVADWVDQLVEFPNGAHDDAVDATAWAAQVLVTRWVDQSRVNAMTVDEPARGFAPQGTDWEAVEW